eukprot:3748153-Ditylum_brightwellii.AAC.1
MQDEDDLAEMGESMVNLACTQGKSCFPLSPKLCHLALLKGNKSGTLCKVLDEEGSSICTIFVEGFEANNDRKEWLESDKEMERKTSVRLDIRSQMPDTSQKRQCTGNGLRNGNR